ncbi:BQ2448_3375 [Microbotryum intermedium]|uniref:BQ2448_3375 protein n=1 Tax=Microbotryum intermedium TaxID=269621 RepID=A0A238FF38_9BASI|nr:BQ2448_3375 [Microbotryum intermedium]
MHDDDVAKATDKGKGKAGMISAIVVPAVEDATQRPPRPTTTSKPRKHSTILYRASTAFSNESSDASTSYSSLPCTCWSRQDSSNSRAGGCSAVGGCKSGAVPAHRFPRERSAYRGSADQHDADPERAGQDDDEDEYDDDAPTFAPTTTPSRPTTGPTTTRIKGGFDARWHYDPFGAPRSVDRVISTNLSAASSTSPLPSLSPSRPPLFDDSDEDEDESETSRIYYLSTDDEDDEDDDVLCTPSSAGSGPVRRVSLGLIREPVKTTAVNDPLLSPPPPPMPILTFGKQGLKSAWLPASSLTTALVSPTTTPPTITTSTSPAFPAFLSTSPTSMTSSILNVERVRSTSATVDAAVSGASASKPLSPVSPTTTTATTVPKISLLTKSLRSLAISLPNLQLTGLRPPLLSLDLEGLDVGERAAWNRPRGSRGTFSAPHSSSLATLGATPSVESWADNPDEVLTMFQLQTFSAPSLASSPSPRQEQALASAPADRSANKKASLASNAPSQAPVTSAPTPPAPVVTMPRYVSNQRHLLMLSLELEMMRRHKISAPLRGRAVVVRGATPPASSARGSSAMSSGGSGLRWEVMPAV